VEQESQDTCDSSSDYVVFLLVTTRLAIISTHPIQYNAPAFRALAEESGICIRVFYEWDGPAKSIDHEFGRAIDWDIPLLEGYDFTFVKNASSDPGSHHFNGVDNPEIVAGIEKWKPDVILLYGWAFASHLRILRHFHRKTPLLFRGDSTLLDPSSALKRTARRLLLRWIYSHVDTALYAGTRNKEYFEWCGLNGDRLAWAPHAVDNHRFSGSAHERAAAAGLRKTLDIPPNDIVFLFSGKLSPIKNPLLLLKAFEHAASSSAARLHLVFAGDGQLRFALESQAKMKDRTHFLGFQNQSVMPSVYQMANVLVLPSKSETWGLAVNEAMAAQRPAIVSDRVGCAPDLIHDGKTGIVFSSGDEANLAGSLIELSSVGRTREMGRDAGTLIANWSIEAYATAVANAARRVTQ
jgi:glycosyltransferase involved in cell wall biosynthesis